jgi:alkylation response protein AidB-like acyl-CoA dehydrogenase
MSSRNDFGAALKLAGAGDGEIQAVGETTGADSDAEGLFAERFQTQASGPFRAIWERHFPTELFDSKALSDACGVGPFPEFKAERDKIRVDVLQAIQEFIDSDSTHDEDGSISKELYARLFELGLARWMIEPNYGGVGGTEEEYMEFLHDIGCLFPAVAMWLSVNRCIGVTTPLAMFGTHEQKAKHLPSLAAGQHSCFAATEPSVGSDLTAVRSHGHEEGDSFVIDVVDKLFITNVGLGVKCGMLIRNTSMEKGRDGQHPLVILVFDLPEKEEEGKFWFDDYGITALKPELSNRGFHIRNLRVPKSDILSAESEGRSISGFAMAMALLNMGRCSVDTLSASTHRVGLANALPWTDFRESMGKHLKDHELLRGNLADIASRIVLNDAMYRWCALSLQLGMRGELEGMVTKNCGADSLLALIKDEVLIHGGRCLLKEHYFTQSLGNKIAPSVYEGARHVLRLGVMKATMKLMAEGYLLPLAKARGLSFVWRAMILGCWMLWQVCVPRIRSWSPLGFGWRGLLIIPNFCSLAPFANGFPLTREARLRANVLWGIGKFGRLRRELACIPVLGPSAPNRQLIMANIAEKISTAVQIVVTCLHARDHAHLIQDGANVIADEIRVSPCWRTSWLALMRKGSYGKAVAYHQLDAMLEDIPRREVLMSYDKAE